MTDTKPRATATVAVVVVNWNGGEFLGECLDALDQQQLAGSLEVIVVDNGSTDGSDELVEREYPGVRLLRTTENNYAAANNLGAASTESKWVALLNSDARPEPDWVAEMIAAAEEDERIGAVGSLVLFTNGRVNSTGIEALEEFHWRDRGFGAEDQSAFPAGDVYGISGCAVLYRRSCWEQMGGLDEDFHMYYEDVDASLRARALGWRLVYRPQSVVHHRYNASIELMEREREAPEGDKLKDVLGERNRLYVIARHYPDVLAEELCGSRFVLHAEESAFQEGIELVFRKWAVPELTDDLRDQLCILLHRVRLLVLERESWARMNELETIERDRTLRELRSFSDRMAAEHESERRSYLSRVRYLEEDLHESRGPLRRAESQALELRGQITEMRLGYERQIQHDRVELERTRKAYETEIAHRDREIQKLVALLQRRDEEIELLRRTRV